jgi:hypothetical protein
MREAYSIRYLPLNTRIHFCILCIAKKIPNAALCQITATCGVPEELQMTPQDIPPFYVVSVVRRLWLIAKQ